MCWLCVRKGKHRSVLLHSVQYFSTELPIRLGIFPSTDVAFQDIKDTMNGLQSWSAPKKVPTPLALQPASCYVQAQPKGVSYSKVEMGNAMVKFWMVGWGVRLVKQFGLALEGSLFRGLKRFFTF